MNLSAAEWNRQYPVGTAVSYVNVIGLDTDITTTTRSEAWELGHGAPVVKVKGIAGGVLLSHVTVIHGDSYQAE
jgi:hypothetical protein